MLKSRAACIFICVAIVILVALGFWGWSPLPCLVYNYTNVPCPGCGLTRSVDAVLGGDIQAAGRLHVFGPFVLIIVAFFGLGAVLTKRRRLEFSLRITQFEKSTGVVGFSLLILWLYWVVRLAGYAGGLQFLHI